MFDKLGELFGSDVSCEKMNRRLNIPLYLAIRDMYQVTLMEVHFVLVQIKQEESFGSVALKKQMKIYEEQFRCPVAYSFEKITKVQRDSLIRNRIPFVSLPEQIYLPFLGVILSDRFWKTHNVKKDKMMPATQQLFLFMLYHKEMPILKSYAAEKLGLTRTSITRASEQLLAMGIIEQEKVQKEVRMYRKYEPKQMYEKAKPYLINPVQKKLVIKNCDWSQKGILAGESALSEYSMLNAPDILEIAINKSAVDRTLLFEVDSRWEDTDSVMTVELWKYDPFLFANGRKVDPISLACSFASGTDERVEMAIEEMLEEYTW